MRRRHKHEPIGQCQQRRVSAISWFVSASARNDFPFLLSLHPFFSSMREPQNSLDVIDSHGDNIIDYQDIFRHVDLSSVNPIQSFDSTNQSSLSPYRKYIEHVLKSRGLGQALSFLHRLHNTLLRKAHASLDVPGAEAGTHIQNFIFPFSGISTHIHEGRFGCRLIQKRYNFWEIKIYRNLSEQ